MAVTMKKIRETRPPAGWRLRPGDIHVWTISLDMAAAGLAPFEKALSSSEMERARRFRFDQHRNRFIAGRGQMRTLLSRYLRAGPAELEFGHGPRGKPLLTGVLAEAGLNFNLAHSENLALLAVTRAGMIGVDVERIRPLTNASELAARFFSRRESAALDKLPPEQKPLAFFNLWTRKEAWLKATGEGIGHLLNAVEPTFLPGEPARFISLPADAQNAAPWILQDLQVAPGFVAAFAVCAQAGRLRCCCWDEEAAGKIVRQESDSH
jgi:4'-phosphopantetheinyl transferase